MINETNFNLTKKSLPHKNTGEHDDSKVSQNEIDLLFSERITLETDLKPMQPLFKMFDMPCFYRGELVADCGKAKSGKTTFLSVLMACATGCRQVLSLERCSETPMKVLWIDTEQSQQSTQEILKERVLPLAETTDSDKQALDAQLFAFNLRGRGYDARSRLVEVAILTLEPDLVIIDGIKDLMTDINDAMQATLIMERLMALAKLHHCCIVCVLHLNKSEQDRNMRGSIGTELTNKAFEVFQCEHDDDTDIFEVSLTYSRKKKMKEKLAYRLNEKGLPEACEASSRLSRSGKGSKGTNKDNRERLTKLFTEAMEGRPQRPFNELMAIAFKKFHFKNPKAYYQAIQEAEELGIIRKITHPERKDTWVELTNRNPILFASPSTDEAPF